MLKQLFAPQLVILYVLAASTIYVHFRGKERLRFARQLGDHSTYLAPYNVLMYAGSAVPKRPVIAVENFPELKPLSDNWETIRDEAVRLFDEGFIRAAAKNNDWGFYSFFKSGWKRFYLKWYDDFLPSARRCARRPSSCSTRSRPCTARCSRCCRPAANWGRIAIPSRA